MKEMLSKMMTDILTVYLWAEVNVVSDDGFYSDSIKDNFLLILILTLLKEPSPWSFNCQFLYFLISAFNSILLYFSLD